MLEGFLFKNKKNGVNHIATGIEPCNSLCGSARYSCHTTNPYMKKVGEKMPLDDLIVKYSKYCSRCFVAAEKQIESDWAYRKDAEETLREERKQKNKTFLF